MSAYADSVAPGIAVAQAIGRLGNYFNQELFGAATTVPWGLEVYVRTPLGAPGAIPASGECEFPTDFVKATPEVLCGVYQPTFLYELLWCVGVAAVVVWADRRFRLGGGRAFAIYVAGYTLGRTWIEMLRIDPANQFLGLRINVYVSAAVFVAAVVFLILRRHVGREDPAVVRGPARRARPTTGRTRLEPVPDARRVPDRPHDRPASSRTAERTADGRERRAPARSGGGRSGSE